MSSQSNKSSLRQFLSERILTSLKAAHLTSTFSVVISRRSQGWMRTDRWVIERHTGITYVVVALLAAFHKLLFQLFQPQAFSLSLYEKFCLHSLTKFVQSWLNSYFCPVWTGNQWQKKASLNAWARAGKQIKLFTFLFLCFLVWPYNKHIINRARAVCMEESSPRLLVQTSLRSFCTGDLGQDSPIQTSRSVNKS